jgi:hypothetical protein
MPSLGNCSKPIIFKFLLKIILGSIQTNNTLNMHNKMNNPHKILAVSWAESSAKTNSKKTNFRTSLISYKINTRFILLMQTNVSRSNAKDSGNNQLINSTKCR